MRVNGYGVRPGNHGYSGQQNAGDEYNRSFKQIRFTSAEEYATRGVKEYHHYPEQKDLTKEDDDDKKQQQNSSQNSSKNPGRSRLQAIQQVVVAIAGSAVVATSYTTAMAAKRAEKQVEDPSSSVVQDVDNVDVAASWEWSEDNKEATLILRDSNGNIFAEIPAEITITEEPAGCNTVGKRTFTATAAYEGTTYNDSRDEEIPALGHDFDEGTEITLDNGQTAMDFTCQRCGEHFVIQNTLEEE